jgi:GAF domain-containing protein
VGVEPTTRLAKRRIAGFEDREGHRTPFASAACNTIAIWMLFDKLGNMTNKLAGVINLQHREPHSYTRREIRLITTIGFLVGAEIERARLEEKSSKLSEELDARKAIERAKGILRRAPRVSEQEAYFNLRRQSRRLPKSMKEIAEAVVSKDIERNRRKTGT